MPARAPVRRSGVSNRAELIVETGHRAKPVLDKATKLGLIVALGLFVTAGVVLFVVSNQKKEEKATADAFAAAQDTFMAQMRGFDLNNPADAEQVAPLANDKQDLWRGTSLSVEVNSLINKSEGLLLNNAEKKDFDTRLTGIEAQLSNAGAMEAKDLAELRRGLRNMEMSAKAFGTDMEARVKNAEALASRAYVNRLVAEAQSFTAQNPDQQRPALTKLALAEEELRTQLAEASLKKDEETRTALEPLYLNIIQTSDRLSEDVFTDAYVESTQWRDLLSSAEASKWFASKSTGFQWKITDGTMTLKGPAPDAKGQASLSIGDEEKWRDFVVEIEFTLKVGSPNLYFRLGKNADYRVKNILLEPGQPAMGGWQVDTKYQLRVTFIGSRFVAVCSDEEAFQPLSVTSAPSDSRRGAFGMAIPKGAQFEISKLRIKVLR